MLKRDCQVPTFLSYAQNNSSISENIFSCFDFRSSPSTTSILESTLPSYPCRRGWRTTHWRMRCYERNSWTWSHNLAGVSTPRQPSTCWTRLPTKLVLCFSQMCLICNFRLLTKCQNILSDFFFVARSTSFWSARTPSRLARSRSQSSSGKSPGSRT